VRETVVNNKNTKGDMTAWLGRLIGIRQENMSLNEMRNSMTIFQKVCLKMRIETLVELERECPRRPRGITKMWHMLEKLISLIFRPNIPHDELINVVCISSSDLLLFSRKFAEGCAGCQPLENGGH